MATEFSMLWCVYSAQLCHMNGLDSLVVISSSFWGLTATVCCEVKSDKLHEVLAMTVQVHTRMPPTPACLISLRLFLK